MLEILGARLRTQSDRNKFKKKVIKNLKPHNFRPILKFDFFPFSCYNNIIGQGKPQEVFNIKLDFSINGIDERLNSIREELALSDSEDLSTTALNRA